MPITISICWDATLMSPVFFCKRVQLLFAIIAIDKKVTVIQFICRWSTVNVKSRWFQLYKRIHNFYLHPRRKQWLPPSSGGLWDIYRPLEHYPSPLCCSGWLRARATTSSIRSSILFSRQHTNLNNKSAKLMRKCKWDLGQADTGLHLMNKKWEAR